MDRPENGLGDNVSDPRFDREFDALLDQALAAEKPPQDLAQRIVGCTAGHLPGQQSVLARIGPWLRAAAAVLVLAAWTGIFMTGGEIFKEARALVRLERIEQRIDAEMTLLEPEATDSIEILTVEQSTDELLDALTAIRNEMALDQESDQF